MSDDEALKVPPPPPPPVDQASKPRDGEDAPDEGCAPVPSSPIHTSLCKFDTHHRVGHHEKKKMSSARTPSPPVTRARAARPHLTWLVACVAGSKERETYKQERRSSPRKERSKERETRVQSPSEGESTCLHVSNLTRNVTAAHLEEIFGMYGSVKSAELAMDRQVCALGLLSAASFVRGCRWTSISTTRYELRLPVDLGLCVPGVGAPGGTRNLVLSLDLRSALSLAFWRYIRR
jgi:hypothetical protein